MDGERLAGIVTLEDLRRAEPPTVIGLDLVRITDTLSGRVIRRVVAEDRRAIGPDAPVVEAAWMMLKHSVIAPPMAEWGQLVGVPPAAVSGWAPKQRGLISVDRRQSFFRPQNRHRL